jgi:ketosteroid isomerase-like protein
VKTNADIVRAASDAVVRGDALALMGYLAPEIRWEVHAADPEGAPWFGVYHGKREVLQFLENIAAIGPVEITERALAAQGDLVVIWVHVKFCGPHGRTVDTDEAQFWRLVDGRIATVDILLDTAAVAAAFA